MAACLQTPGLHVLVPTPSCLVGAGVSLFEVPPGADKVSSSSSSS